MSRPEIVNEIIEAHGGVERWRSLKSLDVELSAGGFLFTMKRVTRLNHVRLLADVAEPRLVFRDFPDSGQEGEFRGDKEVVVTDSNGEIAARKENPRTGFGNLRHQFYWDKLDFLYFAGYATWNYLVTPFLFLRDGFKFEEVEPGSETENYAKKLVVIFPESLPTHCRKQTFYFDEKMLLRRLDYTAEVVGGWARAAHFCDDYRDFDGLKIPTRRRVLPKFIGNYPVPWPTLVAIDIHRAKGVMD